LGSLNVKYETDVENDFDDFSEMGGAPKVSTNRRKHKDALDMERAL
jgi:hypothetical protein